VKGEENVVADALSRSLNMVTCEEELTPTVFAREQKACKDTTKFIANTKLAMRNVKFEEQEIICDITSETERPIVPKTLRRQIFKKIHCLAHTGIRATRTAILSKYMWPGARTDVRNWVKTCTECQKNKIHRHTHAPLGSFPEVTHRFHHIHMDIVGPLTPSRGQRYLLTIVDRCTKWQEVIPMADITASTVTQAFLQTWVTRFGCPQHITTDRGAQFTSSLFKAFTQVLGTQIHHTTAYHPQANGMVERFHRQLKTSMRCQPNAKADWVDALPLIMLGLRTTCKHDMGYSPAQAVYGQALCIPGQMTRPYKVSQTSHESIKRLQAIMSKIRPPPTRDKNDAKTYVPHDLTNATHVFVRVDAVQPPLSSPYKGPYKVLSRHTRTYVIQKENHTDTVTIDRLKPAHLEISDEEATDNQRKPEVLNPQQKQHNRSTQKEKPENENTHAVHTTRTGRTIVLPNRYR
jgi:cleavage and polyadenylation specificity factor subunit 1